MNSESLLLLQPTKRARARRRSVNCWLGALLLLACVLAIALLLGLLASALLLEAPPRSSGEYERAAVATDAAQCSTVGVDILRQGGSAVDSAIASLLCVGVVNLHSTGIGGGGFMLYYNATSGETTALDYREVAPAAASTHMYNGTAEDASERGGLAIAVPAELRGLEMAWKKFGRLKWHKLFEPAIALAENGFQVSSTIESAIHSEEKAILSGNYSGLQELVAPDNVPLKEGDTLRRTDYAETLRKVSQHGADYFYNSSFTEEMVSELRAEYNSIITVEDLHNYAPIERSATLSEFGKYKVLGVPTPAGGHVLELILSILDGYNFTKTDSGVLAYHRMVEAMKFTYGQRLGLGDPAFNATVQEVIDYMVKDSTAEYMHSRITDSETHDPPYYEPRSASFSHSQGTSHLSVLAANGDAVAATSTINSYFGSLVRSKSSGVIFNDEMDDFGIPEKMDPGLKPTPSNYIDPGKRPLSSMSPTIVLNGSSVAVVAGASGGSKITTAVAQVILSLLSFGIDLEDAISKPRFHHQLYPNHITVETAFPDSLKQGLAAKGHNISVSSSHAVVQGIYSNGETIYATSDPRKGGKPDGY